MEVLKLFHHLSVIIKPPGGRRCDHWFRFRGFNPGLKFLVGKGDQWNLIILDHLEKNVGSLGLTVFTAAEDESYLGF
jgi:hypothetical protein